MLGLGLLTSMGGLGPKLGMQAWGAKKDRQHQEDMFKRNWAMQKRFAKKGIQWRVADAKKAGIHPLAAMGANPAAGQAVHVGGGSTMSNAMSNMGQDISRAMSAATKTLNSQEHRLNEAKIRNAELQNSFLEKRIANQTQDPVGTQAGLVKEVPLTKTATPLDRDWETIL